MQDTTPTIVVAAPSWQADRDTSPPWIALMRAFMTAADRLSFAIALVGMAAAIVLTGVMTWEVVVRRLLNSPTLWAYDVSYMLNGAVVFLGGAYTLIKNEHVRIDFLATRMSARAQDLVNVAFYALLFLPTLGVLTYTAVSEAWIAYASGAVEAASTWGPLTWPFYAMLAVGLVALFLQCIAQMFRHALAAYGMERSPLLRAEGEGLS